MLTTIALLLNLASPAAMAQSTSYSSCYAYTDCYGYNQYGQLVKIGRISCQVYGSSTAYGNTSSACSWYVKPYERVECSGYVRAKDYNGNYFWAWQNYNYSCPGY